MYNSHDDRVTKYIFFLDAKSQNIESRDERIMATHENTSNTINPTSQIDSLCTIYPITGRGSLQDHDASNPRGEGPISISRG